MSENSSKISVVRGTGIPLPGDDIDTDRIIPARYLKCITFEGIGQYSFYDERFDERGNQKNHPFNDKKYRNGSILIVNKNFGCGSSREHAPQALMRFGVKAIVGESFAEIFAGNCRALGIPIVTAPRESIRNIMQYVQKNPSVPIEVDIQIKKVHLGEYEFAVDMPESVRLDLTEGTWDSTALLLQHKSDIGKAVSRLPYLTW